MCELQTAREWSDDEEGGYGDPDDEEGLASSPSIWGTPRQNSLELTFSYIAIAEAEAVGAARHLRDRRRGSSRGNRVPLIRTDTLETLLDSPDVDWDPHAFLSQEQEEDASERGDQETVDARMASEAERWEQHRQSETITIQPSPQDLGQDTQGRYAGIQREETPSNQTVQPLSPSPSSQHQSPSQILQGEKYGECVKRLFCFIVKDTSSKEDHDVPTPRLLCTPSESFSTKTKPDQAIRSSGT